MRKKQITAKERDTIVTHIIELTISGISNSRTLQYYLQKRWGHDVTYAALARYREIANARLQEYRSPGYVQEEVTRQIHSLDEVEAVHRAKALKGDNRSAKLLLEIQERKLALCGENMPVGKPTVAEAQMSLAEKMEQWRKEGFTSALEPKCVRCSGTENKEADDV